ncbi:MAG TPA: ABC transporter ATP-binding protein [Acidobacteriota bacterium]|nr:ABC transporter ATP-binding protein [Acidobacteriota bacterium]
MPTTIEVETLVFRYHLTEALHGISFHIESGEVVGLLGPNGAGKSTTLKILTGILSPGAGAVQIKGFSLPEQRLEAKRVIGYVPESAGLYESLTAMEYLELIGRLREIEEKALRQKILALLDVFDVSKQRFHRLATFSKGMRQKILIAAALLHDPAVLLLDEPLTGLDVSTSLIIKDLLSALSREGKTILYSSHVLDVVERVCNRVLIIHQGHLIADGTMDSLKDQTKGSTLEEVFRQLTHTASTEPLISRALQAMKL